MYKIQRTFKANSSNQQFTRLLQWQNKNFIQQDIKKGVSVAETKQKLDFRQKFTSFFVSVAIFCYLLWNKIKTKIFFFCSLVCCGFFFVNIYFSPFKTVTAVYRSNFQSMARSHVHYQISDNLSLIKSSAFVYGRNRQIRSCPQLLNSDLSPWATGVLAAVCHPHFSFSLHALSNIQTAIKKSCCFKSSCDHIYFLNFIPVVNLTICYFM